MKATASSHVNWIAFDHYRQSTSIRDFELLLPVLLYLGYQDIVSTWLAAFVCPELIQKFDCMTLTQFCSLWAAMWTLASYADKDKENVYQTPGFNKNKNPNFGWLLYLLCHFYNVLISFHVTLKVVYTQHFSTLITP